MNMTGLPRPPGERSFNSTGGTTSTSVQAMACRLSVPCHYLNQCRLIVNWTHVNKYQWNRKPAQIAKFMGLTWGPPGSCRPRMGPMLAILLSGTWISSNGTMTSNDFYTYGAMCWVPIGQRHSLKWKIFSWFIETIWHEGGWRPDSCIIDGL